MSKIKFKWVDIGYLSIREEVPGNKKALERQENKRINHQVKQINRNQRRVQFTQFGRTR